MRVTASEVLSLNAPGTGLLSSEFLNQVPRRGSTLDFLRSYIAVKPVSPQPARKASILKIGFSYPFNLSRPSNDTLLVR